MQALSSEQQGITELLTRLYRQIEPVERQQKLIYGGKDFRARIEHFHDALRALSTQDTSATEQGGRLTLEWLAFDLSAIRYIQAYPMTLLDLSNPLASGGYELVQSGLPPKTNIRRLERQVKSSLSEWYKEYGVLYAALFKPFADNDYHDRVEEASEQLQFILEHGGSMKPSDLKTLIDQLDATHKQYALQQLGIYEEGKDIVKSYATQGMPVVGNFVQNALRETGQGTGRGY